jgi:hypothetical protein
VRLNHFFVHFVEYFLLLLRILLSCNGSHSWTITQDNSLNLFDRPIKTENYLRVNRKRNR